MYYTYLISSYMIRIIIFSPRKMRRSVSDVFYKNFLKENINFQRKNLSFQKTKRNYECYVVVYALNACYICIMPYICMCYVYICIVYWLLMFVFYLSFLMFYQENDDILLWNRLSCFRVGVRIVRVSIQVCSDKLLEC